MKDPPPATIAGIPQPTVSGVTKLRAPGEYKVELPNPEVAVQWIIAELAARIEIKRRKAVHVRQRPNQSRHAWTRRGKGPLVEPITIPTAAVAAKIGHLAIIGQVPSSAAKPVRKQHASAERKRSSAETNPAV